MKCFVFKAEPVGSLYRQLLDFCCACAAKMLLIVREPAPSIHHVLAQLEPNFLLEERVHEWPGTVLLYGGQATAHWHTVSPTLVENLKTLASGLFDWAGLKPEDPCFFRQDGRVLLVTISHEREAYMLLTEDEQEVLIRDYAELTSILVDEGEVD